MALLSNFGCGVFSPALVYMYRKVASSNTSRLEAHAGLFQIAYEGDFRSLCTLTF